MSELTEPKTGEPGRDELPVVYLRWDQWLELRDRIAALEAEIAALKGKP